MEEVYASSEDLYEDDASSDVEDGEGPSGSREVLSSSERERDLEAPEAAREGDENQGGGEVDEDEEQTETTALLPPPQSPPEVVNWIPYFKRNSYIRIKRRLKRVQVRPAVLSCVFVFLLAVAVAIVEMTYGNKDYFFSGVFLGCATLTFSVALAAAFTRSHLLFVGVILLQTVIALYCVAFGATGISNYYLLEGERQKNMNGDAEHEEQHQNMLEIYRRMAIREVVFAALFFALAAFYCCSSLMTNHVRAAVRPYDGRLIRKRQREKAFARLGIKPSKNYFDQLSDLEEDTLPLAEGQLVAGTDEAKDEPPSERMENEVNSQEDRSASSDAGESLASEGESSSTDSESRSADSDASVMGQAA